MSDKRIALVTGASRGIGRAIALRLAKDGFFVVINYNGSEEAAKEVKAEIESFGGEALCYKCNVADFDECGRMFEELQASVGTPDVLVNNAGITKDGLLIGMDREAFSRVIDVNLGGAFNCMRHGAKLMIKKRYGRIINISSVSGIMGNAGQANYSASKAAVIGFTKALAQEVGPSGITVNCVAPGVIDTDMNAGLDAEDLKRLADEIPLERIGTPRNVADMITFLASEKAEYITGQVFSVNGGMVL